MQLLAHYFLIRNVLREKDSCVLKKENIIFNYRTITLQYFTIDFISHKCIKILLYDVAIFLLGIN